MNELMIKAKKAKEIVQSLGILSTATKNQALLMIADQLEKQSEYLIHENKRDIEEARSADVSQALLDRMILNEKRIHEMAEGLRLLVEIPDPIGEQIESWERPNGLQITKVTVPLGVIGMIYEARPNVTVDAAGLCLKTGNAVLLRGSSSVIHSNQAILKIIHEGLKQTGIPMEAIQLIEDTNRETVDQMLKLNEYLDVLIPRGGAQLIKTVVQNASVPVIETGAGNVHVYIDKDADLEMAKRITVNAKTQRPSVCNAAETLLVQKDWAKKYLVELLAELKAKNVELRGCETSLSIVPEIKKATEEDWETEYLDYIMAVKVVNDVEEAIAHINRYGTKHSETIVTNNTETAERFLQMVDAAAVYHNASTRFTDGFEFGFGAEIGISTQKLHARGPMGLKALTSYKYIVYGDGQIR
ncbi:glutamate-5-semialdehyde dehydrogenase [Tepidibacillus infernus]|uniref:glutamate-5-semialdehyde dehydrogenase n=1 Tax=Tepidibacillus infernus TaxID=1806172 RepID=UPI003B6CC263